MNKIIVVLILVLLSGCAATTTNNSMIIPSPVEIAQSEITQEETTESNAPPSTLPVRLLVKSIDFDSAKNIYAIGGKTANIVGEYPSGAPMLELGETIIIELHPDEIVKCDNYDTTTIKKLYEDYYLSKDNQFLHYPMIFDVNNKSFINYGN